VTNNEKFVVNYEWALKTLEKISAMYSAYTSQETKSKGSDEMSMLKLDVKKKTVEENPFLNTDLAVDRTGSKIVLPEGMSFAMAIECLERKKAEDETLVAIFEEVDAFPLDGAYALMKVLQKMYGWASAVPTPGFFGREQPPVMVNLEIDFKVNTQVIWGGFAIPGIEGSLQTGTSNKNGRFIFAITGKVKQKHKYEVEMIAKKVREYVAENSVYRGKAIRLRTDEDGDFDATEPPEFLDLTKVNENELVFSLEVTEQVQTNLFTPITRTEYCREFGVPLRRGILLSGPYVTGKTLTAYVTAKKCLENGWTFIYLDRVSGLPQALHFARQYAPAVIFAEDVDRITSGVRDEKVDDVLNNIDGVDSKGHEIITILTTNHIENISRAMLRPGRLDAVINVNPPDTIAAEKLMRLYARGLIKGSEDLTEAANELAGTIPAFIREAVERSKLYAISHLGNGETLQLTGKDLAIAAKGMKAHLALMEPPKPRELSTMEQFGKTFGEHVAKAIDNKLPEKLMSQIEEIRDRV